MKKRVSLQSEAEGRAALVKWLVCLSVCGGAVCLRTFCPEGTRAIQQCVFGTDEGSVAAAFASLEEHGDKTFSDAVAAFCSELLPDP